MVDGSVVVSEFGEFSVEDSDKEGRHRLVRMLARLRSLRSRARRLGVWHAVLEDTERGLVDATLLLRRLGVRLRSLIEKLCFKLERGLRAFTLERLKAAGLRAASTLVEFFNAHRLLEDEDYLLYLGVRELMARTLRATVMV